MVLLAPPFDHMALDPGYIKGYPPGIRENGGQYTHAALWSVIAFATLGEGDKAHGLFSLLEPDHPRERPCERRSLSGRAICRGGRRVRRGGHVGRGGWTWYTGSAGWMYRAGLEWLLGFRLRGDTLLIDPCIPRSWPRFEITFRYRSARYTLVVENPQGLSRGVSSVTVDGAT
jgi:Cellobiose phosphorylase